MILTVLIHSNLTSAEALDIKLYNYCEQQNKPKNINLKEYKKDEVLFRVTDPNYPDLGKAIYKGVPLRKIFSDLPCNKNIRNINFTVLAKDQYVLYGTIDELDAIVCYEINAKPIAQNYGGPVKIVYENFPSQESSIWHINSIILGSIKEPSLKIANENNVERYDIHLLKLMKTTVEKIHFMVPRGYRTEENINAELEVTYVPLSDILNHAKVKANRIEFKSFSNIEFRTIKSDLFKNIYIVFQFDGKIIPIQWGGPFIVAFKNRNKEFDVDKQPYYFIDTVRIK